MEEEINITPEVRKYFSDAVDKLYREGFRKNTIIDGVPCSRKLNSEEFDNGIKKVISCFIRTFSKNNVKATPSYIVEITPYALEESGFAKLVIMLNFGLSKR